MKQYTVDKPLKLDQFSIQFSRHVRRVMYNERSAGMSVFDVYKMYADRISEDYKKVLDIATIKGDIPTNRVLKDMGLTIHNVDYIDYESERL